MKSVAKVASAIEYCPLGGSDGSLGGGGGLEVGYGRLFAGVCDESCEEVQRREPCEQETWELVVGKNAKPCKVQPGLPGSVLAPLRAKPDETHFRVLGILPASQVGSTAIIRLSVPTWNKSVDMLMIRHILGEFSPLKGPG